MVLEFDFTQPEPDKRDKGYICSCCGLFVKRYRRTFNTGMAIALIHLYRNLDRGYIHVEKSLQANGFQRCGDFSYLKHYRFIEQLPEDRADGSNRNGMYKITGVGMLFVEGKCKVKKHFLMFNNKCEGFEGKEIDIHEALTNKFSYADLMSMVRV